MESALKITRQAALALAVVLCGAIHHGKAAPGRGDRVEGVVIVAQADGSILPHAQGRTFADLESYLAHLRRLGTMDIPFYEEISPGRYKLNSGRGSNRMPEQIFTRDELLKKFRFER